MILMGRNEVLLAYISLAISVAWYFRSRPPRVFFKGQERPKLPQSTTLSEEQVAGYNEDGYLLIREFVSNPGELKGLIQASKTVQDTYSLMDIFGSIFYSKLAFQQWREHPEFASLVFESSLPSISAQLLGETKSIRLMKDALFAQSSESRGCGYVL